MASTPSTTLKGLFGARAHGRSTSDSTPIGLSPGGSISTPLAPRAAGKCRGAWQGYSVNYVFRYETATRAVELEQHGWVT